MAAGCFLLCSTHLAQHPGHHHPSPRIAANASQCSVALAAGPLFHVLAQAALAGTSINVGVWVLPENNSI